MVMTRSASSAARAAEFAAVAPAAFKASTLRCTTSYTTKAWPALSRLRAMGAPICPSPTKPIFMGGLSLEADRCVHGARSAAVIEPARRNGLGLCIELNHLLAVGAQITELRAARSGETEKRHRYGYRHVDANLSDV